MSSRALPTIGAVLLALGAAVCAWADAGGPLRAALGLLLVCFLPGAALLARPLRGWTIEAAAVACALSLSVAVLAGVGIGIAHAGFGGRTFASVLAGVTLLAAAWSLLHPLHRRAAEPLPSRRVRWRELIAGGLAAAIAAGAIVVAHRDARAHAAGTLVAELWALPLQTGDPRAFEVGVRNLGDRAATFRLVVRAGSTTRVQTVRLAPGAQRLERMTTAMPTGLGLVQVQLQGGAGGPALREVDA